MKKRTPAQQQYHELKQQNPESVLLFRMGDFYETFHEDAHIAHKVLGITLTARDKKSPHPIPMAGIPYHALDKYLPKLINAGYKVAIAEQVGEVVPGTVVRREVTQRITPGTRGGSEDLFRYIVAIWFDGEKYWTVHGDTTLGSYMTGVSKDVEALFQRLMSIDPYELVLDVQLPNKHEIERWANQVKKLAVSISDVPTYPVQFIQSLTGTDSLEGYGDALSSGGVYVSSLLFNYLNQIQGSFTLQKIGTRGSDDLVRLDPLTIRNLELFQSQYEGTKEHSLIAVIDRCKTAMGSRLLSELIRSPSKALNYLHSSHDRIRTWLHDPKSNHIHAMLGSLTDLAKIPSRCIRGYDTQKLLIEIKSNAEQVLLESEVLKIYTPTLALHHRLQKIVACIDSDGERFFVEGFDNQLDHLYMLTQEVDSMLLTYHQAVVTHTGINGVRIKYTGSQGYCLETSKKDAKKLMDSATADKRFAFYPRQSLKSAERFSSPYLAQLEDEIHQAQQNYERCFEQCITLLSHEFQKFHTEWYERSHQVACHDVALGCVELIDRYKRSLPAFSGSGELKIVGGRHPVVEKFLSHDQQFIPNDLCMGEHDTFHCITGPNMGGKSTYLRQNALIILLGHAGLPVPANQAIIPLVDGIFARVGSGDALAKNQSTFMTEMIEMANIINNATKDSFIVLDELGRGTSTFDGMALAHALSVNLCQLGAYTLFATHYHELIALEKVHKNFSNWQVGVVETDRDVVFMKKIVSGGADKSYGLHVARRAGIPGNIVDHAQDKLNELIKNKEQVHQPLLVQNIACMSDEISKKEKIIEQFLSKDLEKMTPLDALVHLHQLKKQLLQLTSTDSSIL